MIETYVQSATRSLGQARDVLYHMRLTSCCLRLEAFDVWWSQAVGSNVFADFRRMRCIEITPDPLANEGEPLPYHSLTKNCVSFLGEVL